MFIILIFPSDRFYKKEYIYIDVMIIPYLLQHHSVFIKVPIPAYVSYAEGTEIKVDAVT